MTAILGMLSGGWSKLATYAVAIGASLAAVLGFALFERRAGAQGVRAAELEREVADTRTAETVRADVARMSDAEVEAELLRDARP